MRREMSVNGGGEAARPLLPADRGEGLGGAGGYQTGSLPRVLASAPAVGAGDVPALGGISILAANATSPRDVASIVNNYRKSGDAAANPADATRTWSVSDYACCLVPAWLLCCRVYTNTPTSVHFVQDFKGHVTADTAALGAVTNLFSRDLGAVDFQSLNAQNYYARYGNIHIVFVPQLQYAKVVKDGQYVFLGAGYHVLPAMHFHVEGLVDTAQDVIHHGNTYIFNVPAGRVAVVSDTTKSREQQLEVLQSGHEERSSRTLRYTMLSVARQRMAVEEVVMTSDNYRLTIKGFISFRVEKPEVLIREFGFSQDLQTTVNSEVKKLVEAAFNKAASAAAYRVALEHNLEVSGVAPRNLPQVAGHKDAEANAREMLARADAAAVEVVGKARDAHPAQADREAAAALVQAFKGGLTIYAGDQDGLSVNQVLRQLAATAPASRPQQ